MGIGRTQCIHVEEKPGGVCQPLYLPSIWLIYPPKALHLSISWSNQKYVLLLGCIFWSTSSKTLYYSLLGFRFWDGHVVKVIHLICKSRWCCKICFWRFIEQWTLITQTNITALLWFFGTMAQNLNQKFFCSKIIEKKPFKFSPNLKKQHCCCVELVYS